MSDAIEQLLRELDAKRDDAELLAVLGDGLQRAGDPRGELIALQLAIRKASREEAVQLSLQQQKLFDQLAPVFGGALAELAPRDDTVVRGDGRLPPLGTTLSWGIGYVRALRLSVRTGAEVVRAERNAIAAALDELWRHPSMRFLDELECGDPASVALVSLQPPSSVRSLVADAEVCTVTHVAELANKLPGLQRLRVHGAIEDLDRLASESLSSIRVTIHEQWWERIVDALGEATLPALRRLALHCVRLPTEWFTSLCERLAQTGLLHRLAVLELRDNVVTERAARAIADGLLAHIRTHVLERLDVRAWDVSRPLEPSVRAILAPTCRELLPAAPVESTGVWVEHANKPEWGRGTIVRRFDDKIEIVFPNAGSKTFKADAAFLRYSSS